MKTMTLEIDEQQVKATRGMTLLEAAGKLGIEIPTLCNHPKLAPYGGCRLCSVEIVKGGRSRIVVSCIYPVEEGLVVKTSSPRVVKIRKMLIELLWPAAPESKAIKDLAAQYGVQGTRFEAKPDFCIRCGICVRYCAEVKKASAIGFAGRGTERGIAFITEIASRTCMSCRECFALCPTAKLPRETDGVYFGDLTIDDFISVNGK